MLYNGFTFPISPDYGPVTTSPDMQQPKGLLDGFNMNPQTMGLLGAAASMLEAGGPSRVPVSLGQAMGRGILGFTSGHSAGMDRQNEQEKMKLMREKAMQDLHGGSPYFQFLPTANGYAVGDARKGTITMPGTGGMPALMRGADDPTLQGQIAGAREAEKAQYDFMDIMGEDGAKFTFPKSALLGGDIPTLPGGGFRTDLSPYDQSRQGAGGKVIGEEDAKAKTSLDKTLAQGASAIQIIDSLIGNPDAKIARHPGFGAAVGKSAVFGMDKFPGTDAHDFVSRVNQLKGKTFLEAFNALKGGGQITEIEGQKATNAISRLDNTLSEEEFVTAANELKQVLSAGMEQARKKAASANIRQPNGGTNQQTGQIKFIGFE